MLHVYLFDDEGALTQPAGIEVTITEPQQQLGPIDVDLEPAGPGHYVGDGMTIPGAGTWTLAVSVRRRRVHRHDRQNDLPRPLIRGRFPR